MTHDTLESHDIMRPGASVSWEPSNNKMLKIIVDNSAWRLSDGVYIRLQQNELPFDKSNCHWEDAPGFIEESLPAVTPN